MATTDPSIYIEETVEDIELHVLRMESDMVDIVNEYLSSFAVDDKTLINASSNYEYANLSDSVFDEAYSTFVGAFLVYLGKKILDGAVITIADFSNRGIPPVGDEKKIVEKMIGFVDGKVVKGGYLYNLGKMSMLRQRFHDYIVKAISSGAKMNKFLSNIKPMFKSSKEKKSMFSNYYSKYAYDSIQQATNSIALYIADKRGLNSFVYKGGLVKDSRPFCKEHAGNIYTRADAKAFNEMDWKGKIQGVDFLIAAGGWNCQHFISWLPKE